MKSFKEFLHKGSLNEAIVSKSDVKKQFNASKEKVLKKLGTIYVPSHPFFNKVNQFYEAALAKMSQLISVKQLRFKIYDQWDGNDVQILLYVGMSFRDAKEMFPKEYEKSKESIRKRFLYKSDFVARCIMKICDKKGVKLIGNDRNYKNDRGLTLLWVGDWYSGEPKKIRNL